MSTSERGAPGAEVAARPLPSRAEVAGSTERVLNRGGWSNPDVLLVRQGDRLLVVKDFAARGRFARRWLAPWLSRREFAAWRALEGHPAVPKLLGRIDRLAFAVEYRPGTTLFHARAAPLPEDFLGRLETALVELHRRGVVHGDLRNRGNVLRDPTGHPVLIDFGSALVFRPGGFGARWLLPLFARLDRRALRKWQAKQRLRQRRLGA